MTAAVPPVTAEGWFALHQVFTLDRRAMRAAAPDHLAAARESATAAVRRLAGVGGDDGWSAFTTLVGASGDVMAVHFRRTLDGLGEVQQMLAQEPLFEYLSLRYSFLSVTEAGFYHIAAESAKAAAEAGGGAGDAMYQAQVAERLKTELVTPHVQRRLYPPLPADMPYISFYPMSKRRDAGQNWYILPLEKRGELMSAHGKTGRRYAGRILQIITGAIGLADWEWGVTLFARDPLDFKRLVTEMRFDEVSARYADFGEFFVGRVVDPERWIEGLG